MDADTGMDRTSQKLLDTDKSTLGSKTLKTCHSNKFRVTEESIIIEV
jgi:hypothetical protein